MSISTKTGDAGKTSLWSGERVKKNDSRVEAYGTVDELSSALAEAKHLVKSDRVLAMIEEIQDDLFRVAGSLASTEEYRYPVLEADVERLTVYVQQLEAEVPLKGFVIPGSTMSSAKLDTCRTIGRRAERRVLTLDDHEEVPGTVKKYLNRLSDLIFMLARFEEKLENKLQFKKW